MGQLSPSVQPGRWVQGPAQAGPSGGRGVGGGRLRVRGASTPPGTCLQAACPPGNPPGNPPGTIPFRSPVHTLPSLDCPPPSHLSAHRVFPSTIPTLTPATTPATTAVDLGPCPALTHGRLLQGQHSCHLPPATPALVPSMAPSCRQRKPVHGQLNRSPLALCSSSSPTPTLMTEGSFLPNGPNPGPTTYQQGSLNFPVPQFPFL